MENTNPNKNNLVKSPGEKQPGICCFGELLLRMSPAAEREWIRKESMNVYIGGAELNVATALARWKVPVKYCTALPDNYLSSEIVDEIKNRGINTSAITYSGNRIGIYFLPENADLKNAGVIYDRAHSSFAELTPGTINWIGVLKNCSWFHFSAIVPALNENSAMVCEEALKAATDLGLTISVDLNYRSKLWKYGKLPVEVMPRLINYCQVVMGNNWATEHLLGLPSTIADSKGKTYEELKHAGGKSMRLIHDNFPHVMSIAYTFRLDKSYFALFQHGQKMAISKEFPLLAVIDKAGSGDCFMAGLIYGLFHNHLPQEIVDFAAAAAVGKLQEKGDSTNQTIQSVNNILKKEWTGTKL
jgi:2-dehydro-3-deoxygluconokinase